MSKHGGFYVHLRVGDGAATLAVEGDCYGIAWCSPTEQFSRKIGRAIAHGRVETNAKHVFYLPPRMPGDDRKLRDRVVDHFRTVVIAAQHAGAVHWLQRGPVSITAWNNGKKET